MVRNILVALDGSSWAERALPLAATLARGADATLLLTRAPAADRTENWSLAEEIAAARAYVDGIAGRLAERAIRAEVVTPTVPAPAGVLQAIRDHAPDLAVLTSHGRSGLGRWRYGSVAAAVLAGSSAPTLLIPAAGAGAPPPIQPKVVVALDGSPAAEVALPAAIAVAQATHGRLLVARSFAENGHTDWFGRNHRPPTDQADRARQQASAYLSRVVARLGVAGLRIEAITDARPPGDLLLELSREPDTLAVAMSTHGRTGLSRLPFGSVATEVLHRIDRPLLLVRPEAAQLTARSAGADGMDTERSGIGTGFWRATRLGLAAPIGGR